MGSIWATLGVASFLTGSIVALIIGWIAFHTAKKFGIMGCWLFFAIVAICWGVVLAAGTMDGGGFEIFFLIIGVSQCYQLLLGFAWVLRRDHAATQKRGFAPDPNTSDFQGD